MISNFNVIQLDGIRNLLYFEGVAVTQKSIIDKNPIAYTIRHEVI